MEGNEKNYKKLFVCVRWRIETITFWGRRRTFRQVSLLQHMVIQSQNLQNTLRHSSKTWKILFDTILQLAKYSMIQSYNLQNTLRYSSTTWKILFDTILQLAIHSLIESYNFQILFDTILQPAKYSLIQSYNLQNTLWYSPTTCKILFDKSYNLYSTLTPLKMWSKACSNEVTVLRVSFFKSFCSNMIMVLRRECWWECLKPGERKERECEENHIARISLYLFFN
jgi:hypothetical protein